MSTEHEDDGQPSGFSLRRWSARKVQSRQQPAPEPSSPAPQPIHGNEFETPSEIVGHSPEIAARAESAPIGAPEALPPIDTLTLESDFTPYMSDQVAEPLKRLALKKLFSDPHFNLMDGLDVYIDDYSIPSPLPPEMLSQLLHARFTLDPPLTRVNVLGHVEDVPEDESLADPGDKASEAEAEQASAAPAELEAPQARDSDPAPTELSIDDAPIDVSPITTHPMQKATPA
ncbi:MAG: DUF3306 domain-containing protein [Pseudomonadota bacterium]|nr:DUF3306 domain-containing protein [Pseudomonadota bacterium]